MNDMRNKEPKVFWKMFKKKAPDKSCNATSNDLFKHFQNLAAQNEYAGENNSNEHDRSYNEGENREDRRSTFEELDVKITIDEIVKSCNKLRSDKAPSLDNILYEYFKTSHDIIGAALELVFNYILDTGKYPPSWSKGVIIPLHKKGDTSDPNNYRGISLFC